MNQYAFAATGAGTNWGTATKVGYPSVAKGMQILPDGRLLFLFWATQSQEVRFVFGTK